MDYIAGTVFMILCFVAFIVWARGATGKNAPHGQDPGVSYKKRRMAKHRSQTRNGSR